MQVKKKLDSDEPIDYDYWEQLLRSLRVWKAKAKLRRVSQEIVKERLQALRRQQAEAAASVQGNLYEMLKSADASSEPQSTTVAYDAALDPQPLLKLRAEDKARPQTEEKTFLDSLVSLHCKPCPAFYETNKTRPMSVGKSRSLATCQHRTSQKSER